MKFCSVRHATLFVLSIVFYAPALAEDLESWNTGPNKAAILSFLQKITTPNTDGFVQPADRIAVFDNDGTLWVEKPVYNEVAFALSQIQSLGQNRPEWQTDETLATIMADGIEALKSIGADGTMKAIATLHSDLGQEKLAIAADKFLSTKHPVSNKPIRNSIYRPMRELIDLLKRNDFSVFIVSGGTTEFIRTFSEELYGVSRHHVLGSDLSYEITQKDDVFSVNTLPDIPVVNNRGRKVLSIRRAIGRRPVMVIGNSSGDLPMIRYANESNGLSLSLLLRHDDSLREVSYDIEAEEAQTYAAQNENVLLISMQRDFKALWND